MGEAQVRELLLRKARKYAARAGSSGVNGWCEAHSVNRSHANEFLNSLRAPCSDLIDALGLERSYRRKPKEPHP